MMDISIGLGLYFNTVLCFSTQTMEEERLNHRINELIERMDMRFDKIENDKQQRVAERKDANDRMWKDFEEGKYVWFIWQFLLMHSGDSQHGCRVYQHSKSE